MSVTRYEIMQARTAAGGWTKDQLERWGVPWPPPKGWINRLVDKSTSPAWHLRQAQVHLNHAQNAIGEALTDSRVPPAMVGEVARIAIVVAGIRKLMESDDADR